MFSFWAVAQNEPYRVRNNVAPCLNVRANPQTDAKNIDCLTPGTTVTVVNSVPFWREIVYGNNRRGWVAKKYIEPAEIDSSGIADTTAIPSNAFLTIHFVDVGQGDAIWIQTFDDGMVMEYLKDIPLLLMEGLILQIILILYCLTWKARDIMEQILKRYFLRIHMMII
jgi:hypothetical protein